MTRDWEKEVLFRGTGIGGERYCSHVQYRVAGVCRDRGREVPFTVIVIGTKGTCLQV